jgi:cytochrome o ubiquinol oxidase subunit 1
MMWSIGFMVTFVIGGMTGVLLAIPPADFLMHNTTFLVAHFHNMIIRRRAVRLPRGLHVLVPQGLRLQARSRLGLDAFWCWQIGFYLAFMPLYLLGLMGVTRRVSQFEDPSLQIWFIIAAFGAFLIALGIGSFIVQLVVSYFKRDQLRCDSGDPWDGRTLEWSTSSPPPDYNFAFTPVVHDHDSWYDMKSRGYERPLGGFRPIHMPKNTGTGVILSAISVVLAFALIWYIWWLAALSFIGIVTVSIAHTFNYDRDFFIPADTVTATEDARTKLLEERT